MSLLKKISILLLLAAFYSPAFAAVAGFEPASCNVVNEAEGDDKKTEEEEEPDCE